MRRFVPANVDVAADVMRRGGVIAYPTEAVFGLGCDPQDRDAFVEAEMSEREMAGLPPFGRLAAVILTGANPEALETYARALAAAVPNAEGLEVYGPADAPLALIRGRRRKRFLVRADRNVDLQAFMATWRARAKPPASVRVTIDVDPYSFL